MKPRLMLGWRLWACASLIISLFAAGRPAAAAAVPAWPPHLQPVPAELQTPATVSTGIGLSNGLVQVVVHINLAPLVAVGKYWTHAERAAYLAQIAAEQDALASQVTSLGGEVVGRLSYLAAGLSVTINAAQLNQLSQLAEVAAVTSVADYTLEDDPNPPTPMSDANWLDGQNPGDYLLSLPGRDINIAVIDSGVDFTHKKLGGSGKTAAYDACKANPAALADCPDFPNKKVAGGYDWVGDVWPNPDPACGLDGAGKPQVCPRPDPNPLDLQGHGTHVADIAAGMPSRAAALDFGVAPGSRVWAFKACSSVTKSCNGLALAQALDDAMDLDNSDRGACTPGVDANCKVYDPADVVNLSLGTPYGQPEETLTHMVDLAAYYGSVVVAAAGNGGDRPYIISSPSTADGAISVGQSTRPWDRLYRLVIGSNSARGFYQTWSPAPHGQIAGPLQVGDGAGGNLTGCAAFPAGALAGKIVLFDRGGCAVSQKGALAGAAGARMILVADTNVANTPPAFGYGGGEVTIPVLTLTRAEGEMLKGQAGGALSTAEIICFGDDIVATSSRGPRIADGAIKPDLVAPGGKSSADAGSGNGNSEFGGTSSSTPLVAGSAALILQMLRTRDLAALPDPTQGAGSISIAPLVKALLMNNAEEDTTIGGKVLAPITLQGAGRVDQLDSLLAQSVALDVTRLYDWAAAQPDLPCALTSSPTNGVALAAPPAYYNGSYKCLSKYPFGNEFFNAWNAQSGSLSFGYDAVSGSSSQTRKVMVLNLSAAPRHYELEADFRNHDDEDTGVTLQASPSEVDVPGHGYTVVDVTLKVSAKGLRHWTLNAGAYGANGTRLDCAPADCPSLTEFEYDGFLEIDGGEHHELDLPWQILPKKAAETQIARVDASSVRFRNAGAYENGEVNVFALLDVSPNKCEIVNGKTGACLNADYQPGVVPGINGTFIDLNEIGLRSYPVDGVNAYFGLPPAPAEALADEVLDFAVTVYDKPYRASHNYPVAFGIYIDSNNDGVWDYAVFNNDLALNGSDGRNAVFVSDVNPADGLRPTRTYFFSATDFNSQDWILPVPAAAIDVRSDRPFGMLVTAVDTYFSAAAIQDCSPGDCASRHVVQTGLLKITPSAIAAQVPSLGFQTLRYLRLPGGEAATPAQKGLLFLYRAAPVGAESEHILLP